MYNRPKFSNGKNTSYSQILASQQNHLNHQISNQTHQHNQQIQELNNTIHDLKQQNQKLTNQLTTQSIFITNLTQTIEDLKSRLVHIEQTQRQQLPKTNEEIIWLIKREINTRLTQPPQNIPSQLINLSSPSNSNLHRKTPHNNSSPRSNYDTAFPPINIKNTKTSWQPKFSHSK